MKKYMILLTFFLASANVFGQSRQEYLAKSKSQKTAAFILLGAGLASFALVAPGNASFGTTGTVVIAGGISVLSSIPLFIASGKNKRKARMATAYLRFEKTPDIMMAWNNKVIIPAVSVKIHL